MSAGVRHLVALHDHAVGIDQIADSLGIVGELVARIPENLVGRADGLVGVGQQRERKLVRLLERQVVLRGVEGDAQDVTAGFVES